MSASGDSLVTQAFQAIKESEDTINNSIQQQQLYATRAQAYALLALAEQLDSIRIATRETTEATGRIAEILDNRMPWPE